jgi:hypothetical protein
MRQPDDETVTCFRGGWICIVERPYLVPVYIIFFENCSLFQHVVHALIWLKGPRVPTIAQPCSHSAERCTKQSWIAKQASDATLLLRL